MRFSSKTTLNQRLLWVGITALFVMPVFAANSQSDLLLQEALLAETGERDIPKAIHLYEEALKESNGAQPTAGQIMIHLAICYENLSKIQEALLIDRAIVERASVISSDIVQQAQANITRLTAKMTSALNPKETKAVFAGGSQSATIQRDGSVLWWGKSPALGESHRPILLENVASATALALNPDGLWLLNQDGTVLGQDQPLNHSGAGNVSSIFQPEPIGTLKPFVLIASGRAHHLIVHNDGMVWAWGANRRGQLGNRSLTASTEPVVIADITGIIAVAAGREHSVALKGDGTVWSWGSNEKGELGVGPLFFVVPHPKQVPGLTSIIDIASGADHSIALRSDGTVWAWGDNSLGQLGIGSRLPMDAPVQVKNLSDIVAVAAGSNYSLALKSNGTIWVWGDNTSGSLGVGDTETRTEAVQLTYLMNVQAIAAGAHHNIAIQKDGTVWSWGQNKDGQLGDGTTEDRLTPTKISSPPPAAL